jgi:Sec-independent protein translocase protein TatA
MFSLSEIFLVALVALIVLGPKQLISLAEKAGKWIAYWRALIKSLQGDMKQQLLQQKLLENEARAKKIENRIQT